MTHDSADRALVRDLEAIAPGGTPAVRAARRYAPAAILFAMLVYLCGAFFAVAHLDFTRDVGVAYQIANGERWPLQGPVLNWNLHLGPVWYYLLAVPLRLTHSWLAIVLTVALLAALKFPLAYTLGARLVDPLFGVLWMLLLALPGWNSFDAILVEHTSLVATCVLAFFWMLVRYMDTGSARHLYGVAFLYSLSLHAHPSTYALAFVALPFLVPRWWARERRWRELVVAAVVFLVPLLPFVASQIVEGPAAVRNAVDYLTTTEGLGRLSDFPGVMRGILMTGPELVAGSVLGIHGIWAEAFSVFYALLWAAVAAGLVSSFAMPQMRSKVMTAVVIAFVIALSVVLIRAVTTYYMTFVVLTLVYGVAALGLRAAIATPGIRYPAYALIAGIAALPVVLTLGAARTFANGLYPFAIWPLFDVKRPYVEGPRLPFMPAYAMARVAAALCSDRTVVAHGALAFHLLHDYALETKLGCTVAPAIRLGGAEPRDATHVAGLSQVVLRGVSKNPRVDALPRAGPLSLLPVKQVVSPPRGESSPRPGTYPPVASTLGAPERFALQFDARCDEIVVVTNMYYAFASDPKIDATLDGIAVRPVAADAVSTVYACNADARPDSTASWRLSIASPAPERVDVITVVSSAR